MKPTLFIKSLLAAGIIAGIPAAFAQGTAFTYQGRLNIGANAANGSYDLRFALYDDATAGTPQGAILTTLAVPVSNGLFTVEVDFGNQFPGASRWLELYVRTNGTGSYRMLTPRQALTPTPYAVHATTASNVTGTVSVGQLSGTIAATNISGTLSFAQLPPGLLTNGANLTGNQTINVGSLSINTNNPNGAALAVRGDVTVDGMFKGGYAGNIISNGVVGGVIGGGGQPPYPNVVAANYASVVGGYNNTASGLGATAVGITARASGTIATAMGYQTTASGDYSTAMGYSAIASGPGSTAMGSGTTASADASTAMGNATTASGLFSTAMGWRAIASGETSTSMGASTIASGRWSTAIGADNLASADYSTVMGRSSQAINTGAFVWADNSSVAPFASTAANQFLLRATGGVGINTNNPNGAALAVRGDVTVDGNFKGGYSGNLISNGVVGGFIGGGGSAEYPNRVGTNFATVVGGANNSASGFASTAMGFSTKANGNTSTAIGTLTTASGDYSTAMGRDTTASGVDSTTMGLLASASGISSTAMGYRTSASGDFSTAIGHRTSARGDYSTAMGYQSQASGDYSLAMGYQTIASGITSMALGASAKATNNNTFVWSDGSDGNFTSTAANQFLISAAGGVGIGTAAPQASLHVASSATFPKAQLLLTQTANDYARLQMGVGTNPKWMFAVQPAATPNLEFYLGETKLAELNSAGAMFAQSFNPTSDRNAKENFDAVSPQEVLEKVAGLKITRWNFIGDGTTPHVGPMAQDFHAAFGLGTDDKHIATVDADGVALAAIQGLNQKVEAAQRENAALKDRVEMLETLLRKLVKE